ncbi:putative bifunctional diguanylate cyclase/phosphodiesterase [Halomonas sp. HNIBRBA4712]|uniref:putative bifunctional diguanylate cyclase/phosphodiesterase n=1 Tax=Halomonas sp. HNIBRBA4712 TaxID=3373087 RepID=UPI0037460F48
MPSAELQGDLNHFFLLSQDMLCCIDFEGVLLNVNPAFATVLGRSAIELIGRPCGVIVDPRDYPIIESALARIHQGESIEAFEVRAQGRANELKWLQVSAFADGEVIYVIARDITQRKISEQQLALLERSVESSTNGVILVDAQAPDLPMVYVNRAFEKITGYARGEALGRNCRILQGEQTDAATLDQLRRGIHEQRDVHVTLRNYRRDGTPFWNDLYVSPVRDETGLVTHFIGVQNDVTAQRGYQAQLKHNANHDALTGLPNRQLLNQRLSQGCLLAQRYQRYVGVLCIDLDEFKPINDSLGHEVGDFILISVARRLEEELRPWDTVARIGGDEFIVLLPDLAQQQDVIQVVERLLECIAAPYWYQGQELHVTASIGVGTDDGSVAQPRSLVQQADLAMYKAKRRGRNTYQWYTDELNRKVGERVDLRHALQKAIEREQFELHYQPQIDRAQGRIVGVEALIRWHHPERGDISPIEFIGLSEQTGQIIPISEWVLKRACEDAVRLNSGAGERLVMAVNISPMQFQRPGFVASIERVLEETGLAPALLEIEITEGVLMESIDSAIDALTRLRALGVNIALDDFGTGFSSLGYLKRLPINKLKIDRSFIRDVTHDENDAAIVEGVITMAARLGLEVLVEGVETDEQLRYLFEQPPTQLQGYYFSRPVAFGALLDYMRRFDWPRALAKAGLERP